MALTNKVIFINDVKQEDEKPVEFKMFLQSDGRWVTAALTPNDYDSVRYLGCHNGPTGGHLFVGSRKIASGIVSAVFTGDLNSGKY